MRATTAAGLAAGAATTGLPHASQGADGLQSNGSPFSTTNELSKQATTREEPMTNEVKALFFDVFGTLVDWRGSIAREAAAVLQPLGYKLDWPAFADAWRNQYQPSMEKVRSGELPFSKLDRLHRLNLETILPGFAVKGLDESTLHHLTWAWHRLDGWPDTTQGLSLLRRKFLLAPVSNGNISIMVDLARRNDILWDAILGAEIAHDYKPKPRVYLAAAEALDLDPGACMMVAAHSSDLAAAAAAGLRTAHIARPDEYGQGTGETGPTVPVDYAAKDLVDLAGKLGIS